LDLIRFIYSFIFFLLFKKEAKYICVRNAYVIRISEHPKIL